MFLFERAASKLSESHKLDHRTLELCRGVPVGTVGVFSHCLLSVDQSFVVRLVVSNDAMIVVP